jgi:hypothetical protein
MHGVNFSSKRNDIVLRDPLQPHTPFHIHHVNGDGGVTMNSKENPGLTDDEFREAMDQLRKQKYRPSNPYKKRGDDRAMGQKRIARAEAPLLAQEENMHHMLRDICAWRTGGGHTLQPHVPPGVPHPMG